MPDWLQLANTFGSPLVILATIALAAWKVIRWLRPFAERAINAHIALVETASVAMGKTGEMLKQVGDSQARQEQVQVRQEQVLSKIADALETKAVCKFQPPK